MNDMHGSAARIAESEAGTERMKVRERRDGGQKPEARLDGVSPYQ